MLSNEKTNRPLPEVKILYKKIIGLLENDLRLISPNANDSHTEKRRKEIEREGLTETIQYFKREGEKGFCAAFATLWVYAKRIEDGTENKNPKDDIHSFRNTCHLIANWNLEQELTSEEKNEIYRFSDNLILFQKRSNEIFLQETKVKKQLDLTLTLQDKKGRSPECDFDQEFFTSKETFLAVLENTLSRLTTSRTMVIIGGSNVGEDGGHAVSIYQNSTNGKIYFFDYNQGEKSVNDFKELSETLWNAIKFTQDIHGSQTFLQLLTRNFDMKVFRFPEDPKPIYPTSEELQKAEDLESFFKTYKDILYRQYLHDTKNNFAIDPAIKNLFSRLSDNVLINLLKSKDINEDHKKMIIQLIGPDLPNRNVILTNYIHKNHATITNDLIAKSKLNKWSIQWGYRDSKNDGTKPLTLEEEKLILNLSDKDIINALGNNSIDKRYRQLIIESLIPNIKNRTGILARYIIQYYDSLIQKIIVDQKIEKSIVDKAFEEARKGIVHAKSLTTEQAVELKEELNLKDALYFLSAHPGDEKTARMLLENCRKVQDDSEKTSRKMSALLSLAILENLQKGSLETAETIVEMIGKKFGLLLTLDDIMKYDNIELAQFIEQKLQPQYNETGDISELNNIIRVLEEHHAEKNHSREEQTPEKSPALLHAHSAQHHPKNKAKPSQTASDNSEGPDSQNDTDHSW